MKKGDTVEISCLDRTVTGTLLLASENERSLMLLFEAILDGHVGMMPVFMGDDGVYRALATGTKVTIRRMP